MSNKEKHSKIERAYRILEYLRRNSDQEHTITQASLRKNPEISPYVGDKETYNDTIVKLAEALNFDEYAVKPEENWKIIFDDFKRYYGDDDFDDEIDDSDSATMRIRGLYYNHTFSYEEINSLIEAVLFSKTVDTATADCIIDKIEKNLTTKFYRNSAKHICRVREPESISREVLKENLLTIQQAIDDNVRISFIFNGYDKNNKLVPVHRNKDTVSPYYIVANGGRYYLIACMEWGGSQSNNMSIWRIDLMSDIEIPNKKDKLGIKGIPSLPKSEVEHLPQTWNEDFHYAHLNMSFDSPERIRLRVFSPKEENNINKAKRADYTFLHDWFGNTFKFIRTDKTNPDYDIVDVMCSPYAMANWALQYSDRVEVLEPENVRSAVIEKINALNSKYIKQEGNNVQ